MNTDKLARLQSEYQRCLESAMRDRPEEYTLVDILTPPEKRGPATPEYASASIAEKMFATIRQRGLGAISITGLGWKRTCKALGIGHSYKALKQYLAD